MNTEKYYDHLTCAQKVYFSHERYINSPRLDNLDNPTGNFSTYDLEWYIHEGDKTETKKEYVRIMNGLQRTIRMLESNMGLGQSDWITHYHTHLWLAMQELEEQFKLLAA